MGLNSEGSDRSSSVSVKIVVAQNESEIMVAIRRLWRKHSDTLGFFPEGAFFQHAQRGWILAALDPFDRVVGYIVYRESRSFATIVHLCVDENFRGSGVAGALFREFKKRTRDLLGARLSCRTDFTASQLWNRFGFVQVSSRPAREPGKHLGSWELSYGHPDLFSRVAEDYAIAVIDANVFFDLATPKDSSRSQQALSLRADWLQEEFVLAVTPELSVEINRNRDSEEQRRLRLLSGSFLATNVRPEQFDEALTAVKSLLGPGQSASDVSDRRQLAYAISSDSMYFVTCDQDLLNRTVDFEEQFGIRLLDPVELINEIDSVGSPIAYAPGQLDGSRLTSRLVRTEDLDAIKQKFLNFKKAESVAGLPSTVRDMLARPRDSEVRLICNPSGSFAGLVGIERTTGNERRIRVLRVQRATIAQTLARHLLWRAINVAAAEGATCLRFEDRFSDDLVVEALVSTGFMQDGSGWIKLLIKGTVPPNELASEIETATSVAVVSQDLTHQLKNAAERMVSATAVDVIRLERLLWPLKVESRVVPCYVIPIRPFFASALFDTKMAAESLFGGSDDLLLTLENVYYRSARPMLEAPARVLWYVSGSSPGYSNARTICAASTITSVAVDRPVALHARFKRFGVYSRKDVTKIGQRAMAFTFSQTQLFSRPVSLERIRSVLGSNPLAGPVPLSYSKWFSLFNMGTEDGV